MSKLRGDDALFSLLDEMSSNQGYDSTTTATKGTERSNPVNKPSIVQNQLVPDTQTDYSIRNRAAGSGSIWNPHVSSLSHATSCRCDCFAPTNPHVEVFRRRAHERFKTRFRTMWEKIMTSTFPTNNLWKQISVPSLLGNWHFAVKLQEYVRVRQLQDTMREQSHSMLSSAAEIQSFLSMGREKGCVMDPILVAGSSNRSNNNNNNKKHHGDKNVKDQATSSNAPTMSSHAVLSAELKTEWTRAWKNQQKHHVEKQNELVAFLESSKFRKCVSKLNRSMYELARDVEGVFWNDLRKQSQSEDMMNLKAKRKRPKIRLGVGEDGTMVSATFCGLTFYVHQGHYEKLQILFDRSSHAQQQGQILRQREYEDAFACALFCVLARYDTLEGAGLQSALPGSVFDVLLQHFDCRMECFASPFNCRYEHYCSAFADTDGVFGSVGSFFDYDFAKGGCFQANPPFVGEFISRMHKTMKRALLSTEKPLMFVVFVPAWTETEGYEALASSSTGLLTHHELLSQKEGHFYSEGTQHRRKTKYRVASFDTSVFFLQNKPAKEKWPVTSQVIEQLRAAFETDPSSESSRVLDSVNPSKAEQSSAAATVSIKNGTPTLSTEHSSTAISNKGVTTLRQRQEEKKTRKKNAQKVSKRKKRKLTVDNEEKQQLSILNSLGIMGDDASAKMTDDNSGKNHKKNRHRS